VYTKERTIESPLSKQGVWYVLDEHKGRRRKMFIIRENVAS
jgi:hypothetical protein